MTTKSGAAYAFSLSVVANRRMKGFAREASMSLSSMGLLRLLRLFTRPSSISRTVTMWLWESRAAIADPT
ncbi:hypothetical protein ATCV1_z573R [Acanthocystis turfacea chlorella virus 1]|uniref:Uncharacterized protein z573R n=1 Tax=Chlorovirus heliozoae TaxID=322019 RepID=A7K9I3_9PHYC|nr:hypothetical protein ATCV1_z573R [Acanthocystis turfacea chlorella virus 1]ABT16707.1 hypothetical protein ATCV1_z573R [Acanthocystis turfacea chlorella virus 1]